LDLTKITPRANTPIRNAVERVSRRAIYVFCGDHGSTVEGVSAWPQEITALMVRNFLAGGAAISVLARQLDIGIVVVDAGVACDPIPGVVDCKVAHGTRSFFQEPAMTRAEAERALRNGADLAAAADLDLAGVGEMGIGNTASASALCCAFLGISVERSVGRGAGISDAGLLHKRAIVAQAIERHRRVFADPVDTLAALGGFEIATMAGFLLGCGMRRLPVVVDGFVATAAAFAALKMAPSLQDYLIFAHTSAEQAHCQVLNLLGAAPLLDLGMRLGEGTGAALAIGLISNAAALYREMASLRDLGSSTHG
jgi:nicotinate-nucleotide--dimethylbenzimidazole phosphoribosyltransferase